MKNESFLRDLLKVVLGFSVPLAVVALLAPLVYVGIELVIRGLITKDDLVRVFKFILNMPGTGEEVRA